MNTKLPFAVGAFIAVPRTLTAGVLDELDVRDRCLNEARVLVAPRAWRIIGHGNRKGAFLVGETQLAHQNIGKVLCVGAVECFTAGALFKPKPELVFLLMLPDQFGELITDHVVAH